MESELRVQANLQTHRVAVFLNVDAGDVAVRERLARHVQEGGVETRAERRYNQLISKGFSANLPDLCADLEARDLRDKTRAIAPLKPAQDARMLDNSQMTVDESVDLVLGWWEASRPFQDGPGR